MQYKPDISAGSCPEYKALVFILPPVLHLMFFVGIALCRSKICQVICSIYSSEDLVLSVTMSNHTGHICYIDELLYMTLEFKYA